MLTQLFFGGFVSGMTRPTPRLGPDHSPRSPLATQQDYRRLHDLPDYLLEDIGLTRHDLPPRRWFGLI
ncbi:hypothetical protein PSM7751_02261 [Pseudooceanicola marinus]|uniref:DUF1127 domain-containing protein n=1 Tax=Pseudooceanicola marinus TaxID=396013 RepID=A0A1X6ZDA8_9RHOB|nr:DUF1127 domain-containing protein [Pseudooceanicola marinus]PJE28314.1 DUF1127 domain-containing protein [Pseudooceanicola marinus]SLN47719.1 hypothetical protein PSM7751_02261 [Pseudooceanicola marinus]